MADTQIDESICDCGEAFHELTCAYLDAVYRAKVEAGDVCIVDDWDDE